MTKIVVVCGNMLHTISEAPFILIRQWTSKYIDYTKHRLSLQIEWNNCCVFVVFFRDNKKSIT